MNLTKARGLFISLRFFIIAACFIILLVIIISLQVISRKPAPIVIKNTSPSGLPSLSVSTNIVLPDKFPEITKTIKSLTLAKQEALTESEAIKIALWLGFAQEPQKIPSETEIIYLWRNNNQSLYIQPANRIVKFENRLKYPLSIKEAVNLDRSQDTLSGFVQKLGLELNDYSISNYSLLENPDAIAASENNAHFINLAYVQKVENKPLIFNAPGKYFSIESLIDGTGTIVNAKIVLPEKNFQEGKTYSAKSLDQVISEVKAGKAITINSIEGSEEIGLNKPEGISSFKISKAQIVYLNLQKIPEQLIPAMIFEGDATFANNKTEKLIVAVSLTEEIQLGN